jgi:transcriptional regulator with XRE-family HTH domain
MFNQRKVQILDVERLIAEGKSQSEIARTLGVSKQAISQCLERKRQVGEGGVPAKIKPKFSRDGLGPFKRVMDTVLSEVRYLNAEVKKAEGEVRERLNIQRLKYCAEARKEFELALLIDEKRFNIEESLRFTDFVVEIIGECDEETQNKIIGGLRRGRALRRAVTQG